MALTVRASKKQQLAPIPEGVYVAPCYLVADLGTVLDSMYEKMRHEIVIGWEIPEERIDIERDGKKLNLPRAISKRYTFSLGEKSTLRHDLEKWRGRSFTPEELEGFDLHSVLGKSCQLQVVHEAARTDGHVYAKVGGILALPRSVSGPKPENELQWFSIEEGLEFIPDNIPEWIIDRIRESNEWKDAHSVQPGEVANEGEVPAAPEAEDNLPF